MKILRSLLDKLHPYFDKGGKLEAFYPLYEAADTLFYTPPYVTKTGSHVRDGVDLKRVMIVVYLCVIPAMLWGMYIIGHSSIQLVNADAGEYTQSWKHDLVTFVLGSGTLDHNSVFDSIIYGAIYVLPLYLVVFHVGMFWEVLFAIIRRHEVNEGFFVTTILFVLTLPPDIPLWQASLGISFGIVLGKEIFGGTGKNFMNPALLGRAFLYFAYPADISGDLVWAAVDLNLGADPTGTMVDVYSGATALSLAASSGLSGIIDNGLTWWDAFLGYKSGSIGETSILLITLGGIFLIAQKIASWRIVLGGLLGMIVMSMFFNFLGGDNPSNPAMTIPFYWHFVIGGFAFALFFMATDPVSASMTNTGRWVFGFSVGSLTILMRVINPAYPEGAMLAILFCNLLAPLIDNLVIRVHTNKRNKRRLA